MGSTSENPYTTQSAPSTYNQSPPPDDGSQTAANEITWAKHKDKIGDPLKTFVENVNSALVTMGTKLINTGDAIRNVLSGSLAFESDELTIATGSVTPDRSHHTVDTEADAATDDLDTIVVTNMPAEAILVIRAQHTDRTVVAKNGTGNINLHGDCVLDDTNKRLVLQRDGANWKELARSHNGLGFGSSRIETSGFTAGIADNRKLIDCDGTFTVAFAAAATLGREWAATIINTGSGTITLDPSGAELIDGVSTKTLGTNRAVTVVCDGAALFTLGGGGGLTLIGSDAGDGAKTALTVTGLTGKPALIIGDGLHPGGDGVYLWMRIGDSGGVDSGAADYAWDADTGMEDQGAASTGVAASTYDTDNADAQIKCQGVNANAAVGNAAGEGCSIRAEMLSSRGTEQYPSIQGDFVNLSAIPRAAGGRFRGNRLAAITTDRVQVLWSDGGVFVTGTLYVYEYPTS